MNTKYRESVSKKSCSLPPISEKCSNAKAKPLTIINETIVNTSKFNQTDPLKHKEKFSNEKPNEDSKFNVIKKRLNYLKLLQFKTTQNEINFYQELYMLEYKYSKLNAKIFDQRRKIINGEYEPTEDESSLDSLTNTDPLASEKEISRDLAALKISRSNELLIKGIPDFWLNVLMNACLTSQMIEEYDKPILKHLTDISIDINDQKPFSFTLKFNFSPNEYFTNNQLTKTYMFKIELDQNDPFMFEAPENQNSIGCCINWNEGKNVTQNGDEMRESFFNYFNLMSEDIEEDDSDIALDHEIGYAFKEKIIPRAILYYLGELIDDDQNDYEYLEDETRELSKEEEEEEEKPEEQKVEENNI